MSGEFKNLTRDGYDFWEMASLLQKAIRRCDIPKASFAAWQLMWKHEKYLWSRLLIISAEDVDGMVGWAIVGLKIQRDMVKEQTKGRNNGAIFVAKAIEILCKAKKCRDACYIACNYMWDDPEILKEITEEDKSVKDLAELENGEIPDWVFDVHTYVGKSHGKTVWDMIKTEEAALTPKQPSLFGDKDWEHFGKMLKGSQYKGS